MDESHSWQQDEFEYERAVESLKKDTQKVISDASRMLKQIEAL